MGWAGGGSASQSVKNSTDPSGSSISMMRANTHAASGRYTSGGAWSSAAAVTMPLTTMAGKNVTSDTPATL